MVDILHRIGIQAPVDEVYRALTTVSGVAGWWSTETETSGDDTGLRVRFGDATGFDITVAETRPDERVRWEVTDGPPEWVGTTITFDLSYDGAYTIVLFKHADWREPVEYMYECSTQWAVFLLSLKSFVETGTGRPWPRGIDIHNLP